MFDGYPIYGPYGYSSANDSKSSIKLLTPGYSLRNIANRTVLPNYCQGSTAVPFACGSQVNSTYYGPNTTSLYSDGVFYPLGSLLEDYDYFGTGDLDQYN